MSGSSSAVTTTTPPSVTEWRRAILFLVEADQRSAWNEHVAIDDRPANPRMSADSHTGHEDRLLDLTETVDPHVRTQDAAGDPASRDDAAVRR